MTGGGYFLELEETWKMTWRAETESGEVRVNSLGASYGRLDSMISYLND
jgi:hypothetical protein